MFRIKNVDDEYLQKLIPVVENLTDGENENLTILQGKCQYKEHFLLLAFQADEWIDNKKAVNCGVV